MFEFAIALKYLLPRSKKLAVSLVATLSIGMIALIVWLILVFLSVTEGIEEGWLGRLTKLHGSLSINPTEAYYASYYHKIDAFSNASLFSYKTLGEKKEALLTDPYHPEEDGELPYRFPEKDVDEKGNLKDPVKGLFALLESKKDLVFQEYEMSGALLRLQLLREGVQGETQSFLTQASYVASFPDKSDAFFSLIQSPSSVDLQNLLFLASHNLERSREDAPSLSKLSLSGENKGLAHLLELIHIERLKPKNGQLQIPISAFPVGSKLKASALIRGDKLFYLSASEKGEFIDLGRTSGMLTIEQQGAVFKAGENSFPIDPSLKITLLGDFPLQATSYTNNLKNWNFGKEAAQNSRLERATIAQEQGASEDANFERQLTTPKTNSSDCLCIKARTPAVSFEDLLFDVKGTVQEASFQASVEGRQVLLTQAKTLKTHAQTPWVSKEKNRFLLPVHESGAYGVVVARSFQENGVRLGDPGYLSYQTLTTGALQEQRIPIVVSGFYDPGVLAIGNKLLFVPEKVSKTLFSATSSSILNPCEATGVHIWLKKYQDAEKIQKEIELGLKKMGLHTYWKVSTFKEYPFAKDLLGQFQSDKMLFTLVGIIILFVACGNIISLLILLVSDKKKEIGILRALGASSKSIALIFGGAGMMIGLLSSLIGVLLAIVTMHHIDLLVKLLSFFQGRDAFNPSFYGDHLPQAISVNAIFFVLIVTPLIALISGLVPAIKACRLKPSEILKG